MDPCKMHCRYEDDAYGGDSRMLALLSKALRDVGLTIEYRLALLSPTYLPNSRRTV
ncbi:hypothetical protein MTR_4g087480 [Medicago truncatula]|uniref:Uncharacterized protein n=1 Tax=Medicago truncatula TaxID=3880 RepID=G7JNN5_MEDTR|nr:hypothetical protein MTR_4g087480 [Medicago truncatula]